MTQTWLDPTPAATGRISASPVLDETGNTPDIALRDNEPCLCGSGDPFEVCCASRESPRKPPYGVFVFENYLDADSAREWIEYAEQCRRQRLLVIDQNASTPDNIVKVEDSRRVAERVDLGTRHAQLNELVAKAYVDLADRCFGRSLDWYETPELMRYSPGGFYVKHADSQNFNPSTQSWTKVIDRDLSLLIYLNDDFEGGALHFNRFNYRLQPKAGMAVIFPSDSRYVHTAETVTRGTRYAVVSWASVRGVPKIAAKPPVPAIFLDR